jgi:ribonuclease P protein component
LKWVIHRRFAIWQRFALVRLALRRGARVTARHNPRPCGPIGFPLTEWGLTRSNVRLFGPVRRQSPGKRPIATCGSLREEGTPHETYVPTLEDPPRAGAWISRPHENRRRPQGAFRAPRQRPGAVVGLILSASARVLRGSRAYRLRGVGAFEAVFQSGRRLDGRFLQLVAAPATSSPGRIGYVIGRKAIPRAVDRNRLRRRLRETLRAARPAIEAYDLIVRVKRSVAPAEIVAAVDEGASLLRALLVGGSK